MYNMNIFVGNLGRDPEMREVGTQKVTSFSIACNRSWKDANGEKKTETMWVRVSAWGNLAEVCKKYLAKGKAVLVEGRLMVDPATGGPRVYKKEDGTFGSSFEVTASRVVFLTPNGDTERSSDNSNGDIEIPF